MIPLHKVSNIIKEFTDEKITKLKFLFIFQSILEISTIFIVMNLLNLILSDKKINIEFFENFSRQDQILFLCLAAIIFLFLTLASNILITYQISNFSYRIYYKVTTNIFRDFIFANYIDINKINFPKIQSTIIMESKKLCEFVIVPYLIITSRAIILFFILSSLFYINYKITLFTILFLTVLFICFYLLTRPKILNHGHKVSKLDKQIIKNISNAFFGFKDLKINNLENFSLANYKDSTFNLSKVMAEIRFIAGSARYVIEFFLFLFIIIFLLYFNLKGTLDSDTLSLAGVYIFAVLKSLPYINLIYINLSYFRAHRNSYNNLSEIRKEFKPKAILVEKNNEKRLKKEIKKINLKNISFEYEKDSKFKLKIKNLSFSKNSIVGISSPSGGGKTTFLDILSGLILIEDENSGVFYNDEKIKNENINNYYDHIGYVQQKVFILDENLRTNIILNRELDSNLFNRVCNISKVSEFAEKLENKYDQNLSFAREGLSGGQIQRIGIARALYKKPQILILDEATNALEKKMQDEIIKDIIESKICSYLFLSTHDKSNFNFCDYVFEVNKDNISSQNSN